MRIRIPNCHFMIKRRGASSSWCNNLTVHRCWKKWLTPSNKPVRKKPLILAGVLYFLIIYQFLPLPPIAPIHRFHNNWFVQETLTSAAKKLRQTGQTPITPRTICGCPSNVDRADANVDVPSLPQSTCSDEATLRGVNQTVFSFVLYDHELDGCVEKYYSGVVENLQRMQKHYPGALMRLYSDISLWGGWYADSMCDIICSNTRDFFYCPVPQIKNPEIRGLLWAGTFPMIWRFLPMDDPTVLEFFSRDLDSQIRQREADAVADWRESSFPFHGMRDHPLHCYPKVMGGMWGGNNDRIGRIRSSNLIRQLLTYTNSRRGTDQEALARVIYSHKSDLMTHDSYCCHQFTDSVPFPTRRVNDWQFVGGNLYYESESRLVTECPKNCRPTYGQDWIRC